jgi:hypothetical protein
MSFDREKCITTSAIGKLFPLIGVFATQFRTFRRLLMTHFSFERAMGVLLVALTVILSLMIHSPGTGDVPLFLNWMEVVYQNGRPFPRAEEVCGQILSLPIFPEMTVEQADYVAASLREILQA